MDERRGSGEHTAPSSLDAEKRRPIALIVHGEQFAHGVRFGTPATVGYAAKPFVFAESEQLNPHEPKGRPRPFSGVAVLTLVLSGTARVADTTGKEIRLSAGGFSLLVSGRGAWQSAVAQSAEITRVLRIGIALPPAAENQRAWGAHFDGGSVRQDGPARVLLGGHGTPPGTLDVPKDVNLHHVQLKKGQRWEYSPPHHHAISWLAVDRGRLRAGGAPSGELVCGGQLALFDKGGDRVEVRAEASTSFVFGSAARHPHTLLFDRFSVHTCEYAMGTAKAEIARLGRELLEEGRMP